MSSQRRTVLALGGLMVTVLALTDVSAQAQPAPTAWAAAASPSLVDRAVEAGINLPSTPSWDVAPVDYDLDGDMDFSMSLHLRNAGELRRNNGDGTFSKVAAGTIFPRPNQFGGLVDRHACTWSDFDGNGLPDAYCSAGRYASNRYKTEAINNELWLQRAPDTFTDVATAAGVGEPCSRGRHVASLDVNADGWPDLFYGAQNPRRVSDQCDSEPTAPYNEQSKIYLNLGLGADGAWQGFRAAPQWNVSLPNSGNRLALPWDYNNDGRTDLLTTSFAGRLPYLFRNTGNGFVEVARNNTVPLPRLNGATLADLTGDGRLDLVYADDNGFAYRAATATGIGTTSVPIGGAPSGIGWRTAVGDVDGDGRLDVYGLVASAGTGGNPDDYVYLRRGSTWEAHQVPSAGGDSNDVAAIVVEDRAQFVVLNGGNDEKESAGQVQLIAWAGSNSVTEQVPAQGLAPAQE